MISVYANKPAIEANPRRIEAMEKYNKLIQFGRRHPTRFIELVFKIELIDYQKWLILNTWASEKAVWVCSRNAGKSFLMSVYIMARALLFPKFYVYIMSNTGSQAQDTFLKIENIAKHNIASLLGTSDVFFNELVKSNANSDGFTHSASSYECSLYNGSTITSLVGKAQNIVGKRSNLNVYDEAGKIDKDYFALTEPFTTQNADFKTGGGFDSKIYPLSVPTQNLYASSAEGVDSHLWDMYKECAKNMLMGVPGFFAADINCDLPLKPYINGIESPPLLKQSEIDTAMRTNERRALREYYNIFDTSGGSDAAVSRTSILRNTKKYLPVDRHQGGDRKYIICWDPARTNDNSTVLVAEEYIDPEKGYKLKLVNSINLIEVISPTLKRPLPTPEQIDWVRKIINYYNGDAPDYKNIEFYLDGGSGGGKNIPDYLVQDWTDETGKSHHGIIDLKSDMGQQLKGKFPHAKDCLHIIIPNSPKDIRILMFEAMGEMTSQDLIDFPDTDLRQEEKELEDGTYKRLTQEEIRALVEFDLLKEEIMAIQKYRLPQGGVAFHLPPSLEKKMGDDRGFTLVLASWHLSEKRREAFKNKDIPKQSYQDYLNSLANSGKSKSPFGQKTNPFSQRSGFRFH